MGESTTGSKFVLTDLVLDEISLVDRPANPHAQVSVFKRDRKEESGMSDKDQGITQEQLDEAIGKAVEEASAKLSEENTFLKDELLKLNEKLQELESPSAEETGAPEGDSEDLPEAVTKQLKDAEEQNQALHDRIEKLETERENAVFIEKARSSYGDLVSKPDELGPILNKVSKALSADEFLRFEEVLKAANEASQVIVEPAGSSTRSEANTAYDKLELMAKELQTSQNIGYAEAFVKVQDEHPELYTQYLSERN